MLWSAEALKAVETIKDRIGVELKWRALDRAKGDGRNLVTDDDVLTSLDGFRFTGGRR